MLSLLIIAAASFVYAFAWCLYFRFGWIRFKYITNRPKFWNAQANYEKKTIGGYKIDGFHLLQSFFFLLMCLAVVAYNPLFNWWISLAAYLSVFGFLFPFFYGWIAPKPKN